MGTRLIRHALVQNYRFSCGFVFIVAKRCELYVNLSVNPINIIVKFF